LPGEQALLIFAQERKVSLKDAKSAMNKMMSLFFSSLRSLRLCESIPFFMLTSIGQRELSLDNAPARE
jgi:hypothetical protein